MSPSVQMESSECLVSYFLQAPLFFPRIEWSAQAHFYTRLVALFCGPLLQEQLITPSNLIHGSQSRAVPLQVNHYRCLCKRILRQTKQLVSHRKSSVSCDSTACNCSQLGPCVLWVRWPILKYGIFLNVRFQIVVNCENFDMEPLYHYIVMIVYKEMMDAWCCHLTA